MIRTTWKEFLCSKPDTHMVCPGDSGGPMMCDGFQYGIASHAYNFIDSERPDNVVCGSPDVQTRHLFLYAYEKWIVKTMESADSAVALMTHRRAPTYHDVLTASVCGAVYARDVTSTIRMFARGLCVLTIRSMAEVISTCV